jgi:hypothetical protein
MGGNNMAGKRKIAVIVSMLLMAGGMAGIARAADSESNLAAGEYSTKQLLLLMDKDKSGKVSRQEFMDYMAAEFTRLDVNKDGELDAKELSRINVRHASGPRK